MIHIKQITWLNFPDYLSEGVDKAVTNIKNLGSITLILWKNWCGKTTLLKNLNSYIKKVNKPREGAIQYDNDKWNSDNIPVVVNYIPSSRSWQFGVDTGLLSTQDIDADINTKRMTNSSGNWEEFVNQAYTRYTRLLSHLAAIDSDEKIRPHVMIDQVIENVNRLIPEKLELLRESDRLVVVGKTTKTPLNFAVLSSGEQELVALWLECMTFAIRKVYTNAKTEFKLLLLDEPDVHIHPDLQLRFLEFLMKIVEQFEMQVIIWTHSLAFLAAANSPDIKVIWMQKLSQTLMAKSVNEYIEKCLPVVWGHGLVQMLLKNRILLVEWPDDEEFWRTVQRSSQFKISYQAENCGGKDEMDDVENAIWNLYGVIWWEEEYKIALSLKDRDWWTWKRSHKQYVSCYFTDCFELENIILCEEFLHSYDKGRETLSKDIGITDRKGADIKLQLSSILENITWEKKRRRECYIECAKILWSIIIQLLDSTLRIEDLSEYSIINFVGKEFIEELLSNKNDIWE